MVFEKRLAEAEARAARVLAPDGDWDWSRITDTEGLVLRYLSWKASNDPEVRAAFNYSQFAALLSEAQREAVEMNISATTGRTREEFCGMKPVEYFRRIEQELRDIGNGNQREQDRQ